MLKYEHLQGLEFKHGKQDCYELMRMFYRDNFGIELAPFARPDEWWRKGMNLYMENLHDQGFRVMDLHPTEWRPGDGFLIAFRSPVANHAAVLVENGNILHHFWGTRSVVEPYKGIWRNNTVAMVRHKDVEYKPDASTLDIRDFLPAKVRDRLDALSGSAPGSPEV